MVTDTVGVVAPDMVCSLQARSSSIKELNNDIGASPLPQAHPDNFRWMVVTETSGLEDTLHPDVSI